MQKYKLTLIEISDVIANQVKLPYSTGLIWGYCKLNKSISDNFELSVKDWIYYRQSEDEIFEQIKDSNVIGVSNFVWSEIQNLNICKRVKEYNPNCIIVFGGQGTPKADRCKSFCKKNPYVDILVHGEGELTFEEILLRYLDDKDWKNVSGITINGDTPITTLPRMRVKDIDSMPSPYIDGLFDELVSTETHSYKYEATIESVRGCPYQCTFCEIGDKYFQKLAKQSNEKIFKELDWISNNKIEFFYNADSNFGMFPEHLDQVRYMTDLKNKTGYPDNIRIDWAKSKADKVLVLAELLTKSKMMKGITIALQSMNPEVLKAIKRKNIDDGKLKEFIELYKEKDLTSYIEIIMGLPMETVKSFKDGLYKILDLQFHDYVGVYPMTALPNTPFFDPEYIKEYEIDIIETTPAFFHHDYPENLLKETEYMVVGSKTSTFEDYVEMSMWRWMLMLMHWLGYSQYMVRALGSTDEITYKAFYDNLFKWLKSNPNTILGEEYLTTEKLLRRVLKKEKIWGRKVDGVSCYWDWEEASAIIIAKNIDKFYNEIKEFIVDTFTIDFKVLDDIILYQKNIVKSPYEKYPKKVYFNYNISDVIFNNQKLKNGGHEYTFESENYNGDVEKWARFNLWWGRRNKSFEAKVVV